MYLQGRKCNPTYSIRYVLCVGEPTIKKPGHDRICELFNDTLAIYLENKYATSFLNLIQFNTEPTWM